jgi:hypothetical protein
MDNIKRQLEAYNMINEYGNIKVINGMIQVLQETNDNVEILGELKQMLKEALKNKMECNTLNSNN